MLRLTSLKNKYRRRTLRALYAQTQAYPYAAKLDPAFVRTGGQLSGTAGSGVTDNDMAAILPGAVMVKTVGENVTLSAAGVAGQRAFGLSANFVGGAMDELGDNTEIGVWRGTGSVFQVLAPAFTPAGLAAAAAAEAGTTATEVYLNADATGRLAGSAGALLLGDTARLVSMPSDRTIIVELLV